MTCLPIIIMASCWASSMRQPPGLHCRTNKRTKRIVNQQGLLSMMTLSESQQDSGKLSTHFTLDSTLTLPGCHSAEPSTDPMRLSHWLLSENNRAFFQKIMSHNCMRYWLFHTRMELYCYLMAILTLTSPIDINVPSASRSTLVPITKHSFCFFRYKFE